MKRKITLVLLLLAVAALVGAPAASAVSGFAGTFNAKYNTTGTRIDANSCAICHTQVPDRNPYGLALNEQGINKSSNATQLNQALSIIEPLDSDNDTFINIDEIHNLTFPGNASDFPPAIIGFAPAAVVNDTAPATRTFNVTLNQIVNNAIWSLDGVVDKTDHSVNVSNDTFTTSVVGKHIVTLTAQRTGDGNATMTWEWNVNAAQVAKFNISGFKINDTNGNGIWDAGEMGISGWNITLNCPLCGAVIANTSTNGTGFYQFKNLTNGTYIVTEEMKPGFTSTNTTSMQVIVAGQNIMNLNFTNRLTPTIAFIANLSGSEQVPPVVTSATGQAIFNLSSLHFKLTVSNITNVTVAHIHLAPSGQNGSIVVTLYPGPTIVGRFDGVLAEGDITAANLTGPLAGQPLSALIDNMTAGNTYVNVHTVKNPAGEIRGQIRPTQIRPIATFNISGFKIDTTGSGIQGWNITLMNSTMQTSTLTLADGSYKFMNLANGTYNVTEETRPGFTSASPTTVQVTINGSDVMNINFTNQPIPQVQGSISGFKINEVNATGIPDVKIKLKGLERGNKHIKKETFTNDKGFYRFDNLTAGKYIVIEKHKKGFVPTDSPVKVLTLAERENFMNNNFTNKPIRSLPNIDKTGDKNNPEMNIDDQEMNNIDDMDDQ